MWACRRIEGWNWRGEAPSVRGGFPQDKSPHMWTRTACGRGSRWCSPLPGGMLIKEKIYGWYLRAIAGAAGGMAGQTGARAGVHAWHTGPVVRGHGGSQAKVVYLACGGRHWPPSGYQPSLQESQKPREPLQESQPAGQARLSLRGEELK